MEKTRINLDLLLPQIPHERDECVHRIIESLAYKKGIDKVHIIPENGDSKAQLCFHYEPDLISINEVETLAKQAGAKITEHYGHLLIEVTGIRQARHARIIENYLRDLKGINSVSVSGTGFIQLEFHKDDISEEAIIEQIKDQNLEIRHVDDCHDQHEHSHQKHDHSGHNHSHGGIFGENTELVFAIICGVFLGIGFGLTFVKEFPPLVSIGFYMAACFFGGFYTTKEAIEGISKGEFEIDFLMLVAAIGAAILGRWAEGSLLLFLFSLGHSLEHFAMEKARKSIAALSELAPKIAFLKQGKDLREVNIETLKPGDVIVVKPNSKIAADGFVTQGKSSVNQAPITGESIPVDKAPVSNPNLTPAQADRLDGHHKVFSGSINGSETLEVKVTKVASDSTIARLVKLVNEAQTHKSPTQNFTDQLEKYYVPGVLGLVTVLLFAFLVINEPFSASFYRAMAVLVAASPCALAISTPSAVLSGIARAARAGILIKGGKPLEELGSLTVIAFDKTGTLTEGKPKLTGVYPLEGFTENQLLEIAIAIEKLSDHPLAAAIVKGGETKLQRNISPASTLQTITGRGIKADYNGQPVRIGNKELFDEQLLSEDIRKRIEILEQQGNTTMLVQQGDWLIGILTLMDVARTDAKDTLSELYKLGIKKMIVLTGDNQNVADAIAREIGIIDARGNLLPEQKVEFIEKFTSSQAKVAMVGDGVNDAPAMAKSTVGIAMGAAGSDVALESADIALMGDQLSKLPFAIGLSRKAHRIIRQNLIISLGMVVILIPLTVLGIAHIGPAVIGHEGSTLIVVFNALRLLAYKN
ncbi:MAG: heavy metal translocating P-type ATPase [Siphonobacter sp.]